MDQNDRKLLADPVREAVGGGNGNPHNLSRRAVLLGKASGEERAIELAASPLRDHDGELVGAVVLMHDVTELRGLHRQMSYQATHDALTGLVNRREFERRLEEAADVARRGEATHMLCYLDLDRFKIVNDSSGHLAGDSMLREVAKLLRDAVRDSDTVSRLGGDEFAMLLVGCPLDKARQIADDVCRAVAAYSFVWHDRVFNIGVSIGLIEIGREAGSVEQLLAAADSACYVAKKEGAGRVSVYSARDEAAGAQQRRNRVAAETAGRDQGRALHVVLPAHRRGLRARDRRAVDGSAVAHARRNGTGDSARRIRARRPSASG